MRSIRADRVFAAEARSIGRQRSESHKIEGAATPDAPPEASPEARPKKSERAAAQLSVLAAAVVEISAETRGESPRPSIIVDESDDVDFDDIVSNGDALSAINPHSLPDGLIEKLSNACEEVADAWCDDPENPLQVQTIEHVLGKIIMADKGSDAMKELLLGRIVTVYCLLVTRLDGLKPSDDLQITTRLRPRDGVGQTASTGGRAIDVSTRHIIMAACVTKIAQQRVSSSEVLLVVGLEDFARALAALIPSELAETIRAGAITGPMVEHMRLH